MQNHAEEGVSFQGHQKLTSTPGGIEYHYVLVIKLGKFDIGFGFTSLECLLSCEKSHLSTFISSKALVTFECLFNIKP